jgi:hypothetical protein
MAQPHRAMGGVRTYIFNPHPWTAEQLSEINQKALDPSGENVAVTTDRTVPGNDWESYTNCLDDAYANAATTLAARMKSHPNDKTDLIDWMHGQDSVFSNCSAPDRLPAQPAAGSRLWLTQDRAYQIGAAHFYRMEWPEAISSFASIAADKNSPWHDLADYLIARCLIRQATLSVKDAAHDPALMREAEQRLSRIAASHGPMAGPAAHLLDLVRLRIAPGVAADRLGDRVSKPDPYLRQNLIDLSYAINRIADPDEPEAQKSDLVDWILSMQYNGPDQARRDYSLQRWRQTHNNVWLVAAITHLQSPDPEVMKAAAQVPYDSPAWATVTYARLLLTPRDQAARTEIEHVRNELAQRHADPSTQNLFTILARNDAPTLTSFMSLAPLQPVKFSYDDGDNYQGNDKTTMAGLPVNSPNSERLDVQTAVVLNEKLPVSTLVTAVLDSNWPKQLRFELAMAVWTRVVLLDRPTDAHRLTPILIAGEPGWKPWLTAYDQASTPDQRTVTSLLALMRFPSVCPYINAGAGREEGFVGYSVLRDNWWCANIGYQNSTLAYGNGYNFSYAYEQETASRQNKNLPVHLPAFMTPEMTAEAAREHDQLLQIGDAPAYFGKTALAWVKTHPRDSRASELLGFAFRAMRNGCNLEASTGLRRQVFDTLHAKYPKSEWASHYPEFESEPR